MKNLSRNQSIAIFVGIGLVAYILFGGRLMNFFRPDKQQTKANTQMNTSNSFNSEDLVVGNGDTAEPGDLLTVHYVGKLTDGRVFDSSLDRNQTFQFRLGAGDVIKGWDQGLVGMKVGGTRRLTISPDFGYGAQGAGPIPPNSTLVFEVQLLGVMK